MQNTASPSVYEYNHESTPPPCTNSKMTEKCYDRGHNHKKTPPSIIYYPQKNKNEQSTPPPCTNNKMNEKCYDRGHNHKKTPPSIIYYPQKNKYEQSTPPQCTNNKMNEKKHEESAPPSYNNQKIVNHKIETKTNIKSSTQAYTCYNYTSDESTFSEDEQKKKGIGHTTKKSSKKTSVYCCYSSEESPSPPPTKINDQKTHVIYNYSSDSSYDGHTTKKETKKPSVVYNYSSDESPTPSANNQKNMITNDVGHCKPTLYPKKDAKNSVFSPIYYDTPSSSSESPDDDIEKKNYHKNKTLNTTPPINFWRSDWRTSRESKKNENQKNEKREIIFCGLKGFMERSIVEIFGQKIAHEICEYCMLQKWNVKHLNECSFIEDHLKIEFFARYPFLKIHSTPCDKLMFDYDSDGNLNGRDLNLLFANEHEGCNYCKKTAWNFRHLFLCEMISNVDKDIFFKRYPHLESLNFLFDNDIQVIESDDESVHDSDNDSDDNTKKEKYPLFKPLNWSFDKDIDFVDTDDNKEEK